MVKKTAKWTDIVGSKKRRGIKTKALEIKLAAPSRCHTIASAAINYEGGIMSDGVEVCEDAVEFIEGETACEPAVVVAALVVAPNTQATIIDSVVESSKTATAQSVPMAWDVSRRFSSAVEYVRRRRM
ncbi:hypothetical protein FRB94_006557 [Tulasnella sp. JGI-2019a]|nr:hypothetical protein FRB94_006557 [Tulasnella sp. JGI-2019a]